MTQANRRRRVLIVEDEPALRLSYQRAFQPRYDLVFASTGAEALDQHERAQSGRIHVPRVGQVHHQPAGAGWHLFEQSLRLLADGDTGLEAERLGRGQTAFQPLRGPHPSSFGTELSHHRSR
jgi:CheY-like chemotaxis protein